MDGWIGVSWAGVGGVVVLSCVGRLRTNVSLDTIAVQKKRRDEMLVSGFEDASVCGVAIGMCSNVLFFKLRSSLRLGMPRGPRGRCGLQESQESSR